DAGVRNAGTGTTAESRPCRAAMKTSRSIPMELKVHKSVMDQLNEPQAMAAIRRVSDGYKSFQALLAGFRCGLFDWLAQHGPAARPDIASALDLRGAHLAGFLQALE